MLKIYGSMLCPDCVQCVRELKEANVEFEYLDFADDLGNLKAFLRIRDREPIFASVREQGKIGIPCLVSEDGSVALEWMQFVPSAK